MKEWVIPKSLKFLMCGVTPWEEHMLYEFEGRLHCWHCGAMFDYNHVNKGSEKYHEELD